MTATNAPTPDVYKPETMYTNILKHIEKHQYKRGRYKGDAPADATRRTRSHHRVINYGNYMVVRFWDTDIVEARFDGTVKIDCGGRISSSTTKQAVNHALRQFTDWCLYGCVYSRVVKGNSQLVLRDTSGVEVKYYDGITLSPEGKVISQLHPFKGIRVDKPRKAAFMEQIKASGFKDMFPVMVAALPDPEYGAPSYTQQMDALRELRDTMEGMDACDLEVLIRAAFSDATYADKWPVLLTRFAFERYYDYKTGKPVVIRRDVKTTWTQMIGYLTGCMKEIYETDILKLTR